MREKKVDQPSSKDFNESIADAYGSKVDTNTFYKLAGGIIAGKVIKNVLRNR